MSRYLLDGMGSLSLDALIGLIISLICVNMMIFGNHILSNLDIYHDLDLYIDIMKLQELIALSEIKEIMEDELLIIYMGEEYHMYENNHRLVKSEGYQILLNDVDDISFEYIDETIILNFINRKEEYRYAIGKKEWWRD